MKCRNCGKEILDDEVFCDSCKNDLRRISSREDVSELVDLIEEQEANNLDDTKELYNIDDINNTNNTNNTNNLEDTSKENLNRVTKYENVNKKKNKKIYIIIGIILAIIIIVVVLLLLKKNDNKDSNDEQRVDIINYEKVLNDYGKSLEQTIKDYVTSNTTVPTWQEASELNKYDKHDVICNIHTIYKDGSIYLSSCSIDGIDVKNSYGVLKEEKKEGSKITVYKYIYDEFYTYSDKKGTDGQEVGTVTCESETCSYVTAYDKYALIEDEEQYYLYNYESDTLEFGPFELYDNYAYATDLLSHQNKLYGIYYIENKKRNIYNVVTGKTLKNIKGTLVTDDLNYEPSLMYKYDYVIFKNNGKYEFVNLKTGNVSYKIDNTINAFIEDAQNKIVYMTCYDTKEKNFVIYNSNGKLLFDGEKFNKMIVGNGNLIVATQTAYRVYDSKLRLKTSSKTYDKILELYDEFIVIIKDNKLSLVDISDNLLTTFDLEWDSGKYSFDYILSGPNTYDGKNVFSAVLVNYDIPDGVNGHVLYYYYVPTTKETGVVESSVVSYPGVVY